MFSCRRPPLAGLCCFVAWALAPAVGHSAGEAASRGIATEVHGEVAGYTDSDAVTVFTPSVGVKVRDTGSGWSAGGSYLVDVVSAASVDIVSTATERWTEVRHAGGVQAGYKPYELGATVSGSVSREPDYLSLTGGVRLDWDLAHKTVTPALGYAFTHDTAGRTGTPFSIYSLETDRHALNTDVALVLDRSTTLNLGADLVFEVGNQEKPYRYVPLFAEDVAPKVVPGMSLETVNLARLPGRTAERLPTTRQRYAASARLAQRHAHDTLVAKERVYTDSWGLKATTTDLRWVFDLTRQLQLWPALRVHFQTGVSFWRLAYVGSVAASGSLAVPRYRTGDRELSPLGEGTLGAGLRLNLGSPADPSAFAITFLADGMLTRYSQALFVQQRFGAFTAVQLEVKL